MKERWFGTLEVAPIDESSNPLGEDIIGAIVNVVMLCSSIEEFKTISSAACGNLELKIKNFIEIDNLEPYFEKKEYVSPEIMTCLSSLSISDPIVFDEFQGYTSL